MVSVMVYMFLSAGSGRMMGGRGTAAAGLQAVASAEYLDRYFGLT
jgi:hypothetical protein